MRTKNQTRRSFRDKAKVKALIKYLKNRYHELKKLIPAQTTKQEKNQS